VAGAIWLDSRKTSIYRFYQFWIRSDDRHVVKLLKSFTFLSLDEIEHLNRLNEEKPEARDAHKALAKAMTSLIHGESATGDAIRASEILFGGGLDGISESTFNDVVGEVPSRNLDKNQLEAAGMSLIDLLVFGGLSASKGQARKDIEGGGIYLNNVREADLHRQVTTGQLLFGKHLLLRKGKRNYVVVTAR
jgi:tyrosyl-tRNA synthetase